jgi:hypothetical protein
MQHLSTEASLFTMETHIRSPAGLYGISYGQIGTYKRFFFIVYFLLGNSPASEFYMPTFRNTLSCGRSPTEIFGSNPNGGMDICLL